MFWGLYFSFKWFTSNLDAKAGSRPKLCSTGRVEVSEPVDNNLKLVQKGPYINSFEFTWIGTKTWSHNFWHICINFMDFSVHAFLFSHWKSLSTNWFGHYSIHIFGFVWSTCTIESLATLPSSSHILVSIKIILAKYIIPNLLGFYQGTKHYL